MGSKKIKVFTLIDEAAPPKCIGTMNAVDGETMVALRVRLEEKKVLKFDFQYWNPEELCRLAVSLEDFNDIGDRVFMISALEDEPDDFCNKRQRQACEQDFIDSRHSDGSGLPEMNTPDVIEVSTIPVDPHNCSRVSGSWVQHFMLSKTILTEVLNLYKEGEQKLRTMLKDVFLEDHEWCLNTTRKF